MAVIDPLAGITQLPFLACIAVAELAVISGTSPSRGRMIGESPMGHVALSRSATTLPAGTQLRPKNNHCIFNVVPLQTNNAVDRAVRLARAGSIIGQEFFPLFPSSISTKLSLRRIRVSLSERTVSVSKRK